MAIKQLFNSIGQFFGLVTADLQVTGHPIIEGVTSTGATGAGKFVFDTSPTILTPIISALTNAIIKPAADSTTAVQIMKADGTTPVLIIDTSTPTVTSKCTLQSTIEWPGVDGAHLVSNNTSYNDSPRFVIRQAGGTVASPTALASGAALGLFSFRGYDGTTSWDTTHAAYFGCNAEEAFTSTAHGTRLVFATAVIGATSATEKMRIDNAGKVGIGCTPSYLLHVITDSAGKPGATGLWTVVSDERIKKDIVPADLNRCYEIVKSVPLKYFAFADGVYTDEQIKDKHNLGWIAQDVQKVFSKAVSVKPFTKKFDTGKTEEVEEDGVKSTRPVFKEEVIEDCLDLNSGQLIAALYGAVQQLMIKVEELEGKLK